MAEVPDWAKEEAKAPSWATDSAPAPKFQETGDPLVDARIRAGFVSEKAKPARKESDISQQVLGPAKKSISEGLTERGVSGYGKAGLGALEYALNLPAALISQYAPTYAVTQGGRMPEDVARRKLASDLTMMQQVAIPELAETGPAALVSREIKASQIPIVTDKPAALKRIQKEISPATSKSAVGEKIEGNLDSRLKELRESREKLFENVKDNYLEAGRRQSDQLLQDYKGFLQNAYARAAASGSADEISLIEKLAKRISDRKVSELFGAGKKEITAVEPGFDVLEKERRFLNDVADGYVSPEGAEGIQAASAREMANALEQIIANRVPKEFKSFKDTYRSLSEPINQYARATGAKITKKADKYLPEISKVDPAQLPDVFFKSRRSIQDLRALSADETFVRQIAKEHIATELRDAKSAKEITDYMAKNYDWLQEFPEFQRDLQTIANSQNSKEIRKKVGLWLGGIGLASAGAGAISGTIGKLSNIFGGD